MLKITRLAFCCLFVCCVVCGSAGAGLRVQPAKIEMILDQETKVIPVTLRNLSANDFQLEIASKAVRQKRDVMRDFYASDNSKFDGVPYVMPDQTVVTLEAGKSCIVNLTFKKPEGHPGGDLYCVTFFRASSLSKATMAGGKFGVGSKLGVGVISEITIPGNLVKQIDLQEVFLEQGGDSSPIDIIAQVKNSGNTIAHTRGKIAIKDKAGNIIDGFALTSNKVYADGEHAIITKWQPQNLAPGQYLAECEISDRLVSASFEVIAPNVIARQAGNIVEFKSPTAVKGKPVDFKVLFFNSGNRTFVPQAKIEIFDPNKRKLSDVAVDSQPAKAGENIELIGRLKEGLPSGAYSAKAVVDYGSYKKAVSSVDFSVVDKIIVEKGVITGFSIASAKKGKEVNPSLVFANTGNIDLNVEGMLEVRKSGGGIVGQAVVGGMLVKAGDSVKLPVKFLANFPAGLYKAEVMLSYGNAGKTTSASTAFFVKN